MLARVRLLQYHVKLNLHEEVQPQLLICRSPLSRRRRTQFHPKVDHSQCHEPSWPIQGSKCVTWPCGQVQRWAEHKVTWLNPAAALARVASFGVAAVFDLCESFGAPWGEVECKVSSSWPIRPGTLATPWREEHLRAGIKRYIAGFGWITRDVHQANTIYSRIRTVTRSLQRKAFIVQVDVGVPRNSARQHWANRQTCPGVFHEWTKLASIIFFFFFNSHSRSYTLRSRI